MNYGLSLVSPRDGQIYRPWPETISYRTSYKKLKSRADAGCAWCRFILGSLMYNIDYGQCSIKVRGPIEKWDRNSDWGRSYQTVQVEFESKVHRERKEAPYYVYAYPGTSDVSQIKRDNKVDIYY